MYSTAHGCCALSKHCLFLLELAMAVLLQDDRHHSLGVAGSTHTLFLMDAVPRQVGATFQRWPELSKCTGPSQQVVTLEFLFRSVSVNQWRAQEGVLKSSHVTMSLPSVGKFVFKYLRNGKLAYCTVQGPRSCFGSGNVPRGQDRKRGGTSERAE